MPRADRPDRLNTYGAKGERCKCGALLSRYNRYGTCGPCRLGVMQHDTELVATFPSHQGRWPQGLKLFPLRRARWWRDVEAEA